MLRAWICVDAPYWRDACELSLKGRGIDAKGSGSTIQGIKVSRLNGRAYAAAGQAGAALHTMSVLQAYQADLLKDLDQGQGLPPEAVTELRRTTDLALRATKQTAAAIGRSMAAMVATERHLWMNLADIGEKEKRFVRHIRWDGGREI